MSQKFKVGDRVKVKPNLLSRAELSGRTGTVARLRADGDVWVLFDGELPKHLQSNNNLVRMGAGQLEKAPSDLERAWRESMERFAGQCQTL